MFLNNLTILSVFNKSDDDPQFEGSISALRGYNTAYKPIIKYMESVISGLS